jgi:hypothetical protein
MATEKIISSDVVLATADLRTAQYKLITQAGALAGAGVPAFALQDKPNTGQNGTIALAGISKVVYGATVALGAKLASNASGLAITATTGNTVVGIARVAGVANDVGSMFVTASGGIA